MAVITLLGESLKATLEASEGTMGIDKVILANVPDIDEDTPIDRSSQKPMLSQIVATLDVTKVGKINSNTIVYSLVMGSDVGTFEFNWVGLYSTTHDTVVAIDYVPLQEKRATVGDVLGNVLTRNFAIEFNGAADLTGVTINAESWQLDYSGRLRANEMLTRIQSVAIHGRALFEGDAFKIKYSESKFYATAGLALVGGLVLESVSDIEISLSVFPKTIWLDVYQTQSLSNVVNSFTFYENDGSDVSDYHDDAGIYHHVVKIAVVNSTASIIDHRSLVVSKIGKTALGHSIISQNNEEQVRELLGLGDSATKSVGVANGVAELDSSGKVPVQQLPVLIDEVATQEQAESSSGNERLAWTVTRLLQLVSKWWSGIVKESTGDSTTSVMSQKAVTDAIADARSDKWETLWSGSAVQTVDFGANLPFGTYRLTVGSEVVTGNLLLNGHEVIIHHSSVNLESETTRTVRRTQSSWFAINAGISTRYATCFRYNNGGSSWIGGAITKVEKKL